MEWWETVDIASSFAASVESQANKAVDRYTQKTQELHAENARRVQKSEAYKKSLFRATCRARKCANAEDRLMRANKALLELGYADQIPITQDAINREMSGGYASNIIQQALTGSKESREKELRKAAEHDVKLGTPNWNKLTYEVQQDLIEQNYQSKMKEMYPQGRYSIEDPSSFPHQYTVDALVKAGYMKAPPVTETPEEPIGYAGERRAGLQEFGLQTAYLIAKLFGNEEAARKYKEGKDYWASVLQQSGTETETPYGTSPQVMPEIPEEGLDVGEGLRVMPDYSIVSGNTTIGKVTYTGGEYDIAIDPEYQNQPSQLGANVTGAMTMPEYIPESKKKDVWDGFLAGWATLRQNAEIALFTQPPSAPDPDLPYSVGTRTTAIDPEFAYSSALDEYQGALQHTIDAYVRRRQGHQEFWNEHPELVPRPEYLESAWKNPELFRDAGWWGYTITSSLAYTFAVMGTMVIGSIVGTPAAGIPMGLMVAAVPETGDMLNELVERGVPIEQARKPAEFYGLFAGTIETISDLPFLSLVFKPLQAVTKPFWSVLKKTTANRFTKSLLTGVVLTQTEGLEEVITQVAHNLIVRDFDKTQGVLDGVADAWLQGSIASLPFAGIGGGASYRTFHNNLESSVRQQYDEQVRRFVKAGLTEEMAQQKAANEIAKTPEGMAALSEALDIARDEYLESHPAIKEQMETKVVTLIPSTLEEGVYSIKAGDEVVGAVVTFPQEDSLFVNRVSIEKEGTLTRSMLVQIDNQLGNMAKEQGKQYLRIAVREQNLGLYKRAGYAQEEGTNIVRKDVSEYQAAPTTTTQAEGGTVSANPELEQAIVQIGGDIRVFGSILSKPIGEMGDIDLAMIGEPTAAQLRGLKTLSRKHNLKIELFLGDEVYGFPEGNRASKAIITPDQKTKYEEVFVGKDFMEGLRVPYETIAQVEGETISGEIPEGLEVTVTGLEPVRAIQKLYSRWVARRIQYDAAKKELVTYSKKHLPLEARGKMLTAVKNVKTPEGLTKAIRMADEYAEMAAQKTLRTQITSQLRRISPKHQYGRFTAEIQGKLDAIKKNVNMDRDGVRAKLIDNAQAMDEGKISIEDGQKANEILQVSGLKGMSSSELAFTLNEIKSLKATGRGLFAAQKEAEKAQMTNSEAAIDEFTGGRGIKAGVGTVDTRALHPRMSKAKEFITFWQFGMDDAFDWISRFSKTKPYQGLANQIGFKLHMSRSLQQKGVIEYHDRRTGEALSRIYGAKMGRPLAQVIGRMRRDKIDLGTFPDTDGISQHLVLSKSQIIQKYLEMQDPTLDETFRDGMKWTDEIMSAVRSSMTKEDIEFANWLTEFYQEYGQTIKPVFEAKYHIPFPENPHWVHLTREKESGAYAHLLMAANGYRIAGITSKSLLARTKNKIPLQFTDVFDIHMRHIVEMEHFKAFALSMKEARMIFGNKDVRTAIRQYHGEEAVKHIDIHLDQIASDGRAQANIVSAIDKLRGHFTLAALGVKVAVSIKQALSLPAYLTYQPMPIGDFFSGIADFWAHPMASIKELKELSGHLSERWGRGHERDVRLVKSKDVGGRLSQVKNWRDLFMLGITTVDTAVTQAGAWAVYRSMLKQKMSKEDAITHAEIATDRTQPSFGIEDMAALRKTGSWGKLFTMFQSQPNKYYRLIASSIWNLKAGRGSKGRNIANLVLAWWVLPMLFQVVSDAFQWKKEHQLRVAILGAGNYLLAVGQILQSLWGWMSGEGFRAEASPAFSTLREMEWAIQGTVKILEQGGDPLKDIDTDHVVSTIEHYAKAVGQLAGLPTPYAVQLERAIRNSDPRQIIFSQYALSNKDDVTSEYRDLYAQAWGYDSWADVPEGNANTAGTKAHFNSLNS
jgi:hypothetical protein